MKRLKINPRTILPIILVLVLSGFQLPVQAQLPEANVRFANPRYICDSNLYCVDVEFQAGVENRELFGVNVRFFYDGSILQHHKTGNFQGGYSSPQPLEILTGNPGSGPTLFNLNDPLKWYNGYVELTDPFISTIYLSTTDWTMLFSICFKVLDPSYLNKPQFCPPLVWDLTKEIDPDTGEKIGYLPGDDGVVISFVNSFPNSEPTTEDVVQFNWVYGDLPDFPAGMPVPIVCIDTICGILIPLADWAIYLAIGLMLVVSVFIYRRRISG